MRPCKLFSMLFALLLCSIAGHGQYWDFVYDSEIAMGRQIILTNDSCFLVTCSNNDEDRGFSLKLDREGAVLWSTPYGGYAVDQTFDDKYIIAGAQYPYATLTLLDDNGNPEWIKEYGFGHQEGFGSVIQASDSCFIVCGGAWSHNDKVLSVIKISSTGNTVWKKYFFSRYLGNFNDLLEYDNHIYVVGEDEDNNSHLYTEAVKLTLSGATVWEKSYEIGYGGSGIALTPDFNLILAGGRSLTKMNLDGDTLWRRKLESMWVIEDVDVISDIDSGFILSGCNRVHEDDLLARYDKNGNEMWYQVYPTIDEQDMAAFPSVIYLPYDGFITCGFSEYNRGEIRLRVLKTDLEGGGFVDIQEKNDEYQNVIYPNPSNGLIYIDYIKPYIVDIFDLNANLLLSAPDINELNLSNWAKGLYIARIISEKGNFTRKIIVK